MISIITSLKRSSEKTFHTRLTITLGITFFYILVLIPTYQLLGRPAAALSIVPLFIIVNLVGKFGGGIWALSVIPLHWILYMFLEGTGPYEVIGKGFWVNHAGLVVIGFVLGHMCDLQGQLKKRILDQKQSEMALRESEEKYRSLYANMAEGVCMHDIIYDESGKAIDYSIIDVNPSYEDITGFKREKVLGAKASEIYGTGEPPFLEAYSKVAQTGEPKTFEIYWAPMRRHFQISAFSPGGGKFVTIFSDITEQKQSAEALQTSELWMRSIFNALDEAVFVIRPDMSIVDMNACAKRMFGYSKEELTNQSTEVLHVDHKRFVEFGVWMKQAFDKGEMASFEFDGRRKNRDVFPTENTVTHLKNEQGDSIGMVIVTRDLSEQRKMEEEKKGLEAHLLQAQKMEAIGTLAGGIAHDFNNILYPIIGCAEVTMDDVPEESEARANLDEILKAANRARNLIQQILAFSQQGGKGRKPIRIQSILRETIKLLRSSLPSSIEIQQNIDADCRSVLAEPSEIHQVLMNLCTNAYHALREEGGVLKIRLREVGALRHIDEMQGFFQKLENDQEKGEEKARHKVHPDLGSRGWVELNVTDTGNGMSGEIKERIFEPFFTTKGPSEGTGMGLSVTHGIVESLGGMMKVESKLGKGSSFSLYFPCFDTGTKEAKSLTPKSIQGGYEHILFVDDEEQIANLSRRLFERLGYKVTSRTSSKEALEDFRIQPADYDLVVTDMTMPGMTGADLAPKLLEIRPDIPIILCTGFSELMNEDQAKNIGIREYVMKPLVREEIARTVRKVLDDEKGKISHGTDSCHR